MSPAAVIFDLDGTLLDTIEDITTSVNEILESRGEQPHPVSACRHFAGDGVFTLFERALPPARRDAETIHSCVAQFKEVYARRWSENTRPFPGIPDLLSELGHRGIPCAVLSNKLDEFTKLMVRTFFPEIRFAAVLGEGPTVLKKPDPGGALRIATALSILPAQICFVGDTNTDMKTAHAAGMVPVGVLWGFREEHELREHRAAHILRSPVELLGVFADRRS